MYITVGYYSLLFAFIVCVVSVVACIAAVIMKNKTVGKVGAVAAFVTCILLTVSCGVLVVCFFTGDTSILYVIEERSDATGSGAWLYKLAGLWGGSEGSLLFWAWLISLFNCFVAHRAFYKNERLDVLAVAIAELVLLAFLGVLVFSSNMPFEATPSTYFDEDGNLAEIVLASTGMNMLLEHWAMAVHPPTLFIGYAGFTIPFAYAVAMFILGDKSDTWVRRSTPYAVVSWMFLTIGIGLGAIWAYVVLGWGGYWGWDPVENASLLPWLLGLALIHSFTVVRQRGAFRRWAPFCACLAFSFVIFGTFITRSGIVESVHAFSGDTVSLVLFLGLIIVSLLVGIIGVAARWKMLGAASEGGDDIESLASKDAIYYINNLIVIIFAFVLGYFTIASALPEWMPLGGMSVSTGTYESIARPLGILYCALVAICPLLSWKKTDPKAFKKRALVPGICAIVLFALLMVVYVTKLYPAYQAIIDAGGTAANELRDYGASWYYQLLAILAFAVASLLVFNALFMLIKVLRKKGPVRPRLSAIGGSLAHFSMSFILIGLVGSAMYVTEDTYYITYDEDTDTLASTIVINDYELTYTGIEYAVEEDGYTMVYTVSFDVTKDGEYVGSLSPQYTLNLYTSSAKLDAGVISFALEDLFVVFNGFTTSSVSGLTSMVVEARVNPLISFVWVGFGLMVLGMILAMFARRRDSIDEKRAGEDEAKVKVAKAKVAKEISASSAAPAIAEAEVVAEDTEAEGAEADAETEADAEAAEDKAAKEEA